MSSPRSFEQTWLCDHKQVLRSFNFGSDAIDAYGDWTSGFEFNEIVTLKMNWWNNSYFILGFLTGTYNGLCTKWIQNTKSDSKILWPAHFTPKPSFLYLKVACKKFRITHATKVPTYINSFLHDLKANDIRFINVKFCSGMTTVRKR